MAVRVSSADVEAEVIEVVLERVRERLPAEQAPACARFVRQYYHWVPPEDLAGRNPLDLYGAAVAPWNLVQQRAPGEVKVCVYNPGVEQHGWQSPHTVLEIVSDDMPFIVDSVTMELSRRGYGIDLVIHPVIRVKRDADGRLLDVSEPGEHTDRDTVAESVLHIEVAREPDADALADLHRGVERVLEKVRAAVVDWQPMRARTRSLIEELEARPPGTVQEDEVEEVKAFLAWLGDDNFTFLGYREYELAADGLDPYLVPVAGSGLGILRDPPGRSRVKLRPRAVELARAPHLLLLTKANSRATVHRPAYMDYIGVKKFSPEGEVVGERRFLGLYTTAAYRADARDVPLLRGKVEGVLERTGFPLDSHDAKALVEIIESYPRDALFQTEIDDLFSVAMGLLQLGERQRVRLFVRRDPFDRFLACLVTIPRDRFNTENRERVGRILLEAAGGSHFDWTLQLSESLLARVYYIVYCPDGAPDTVDVSELETRLVQTTRAWGDELREALLEENGEEQALRLLKRYEGAFPPAYRSDWVARAAVADIARISELEGRDEPIIVLYRPLEAREGMLRCKLFSGQAISLSDVLPTFEHMGAMVVDERPYEITPAGGPAAWIYDFGLRCVAEEVERVREIFQDAFLGVWRRELEDDGLGALVLRAGLSGRQITLLRAVAKYLRQGGTSFSDTYMERTLVGHPEVASLLFDLFAARFHPDTRDPETAERLEEEIERAIGAVESLDEDRILRNFLSVVRATLRTNFYRLDAEGNRRPFLSFKIDPMRVPLLPAPRPRFEIFVYAPRFEGVHLRGGKVARGGIRWSDRREDFRTEVLGLMKAQMVKNALIVPVGSKGGFVLKRPPAGAGREAVQEEAVACYRMFLAGLLDLTDNISSTGPLAPDRVVRYDADDPYLVVAADKGTASFSDIANEVSGTYGFWLGDAFASGGSHGYDHKQMGITARGAWESVKRHFRELGIDIQRTEFTAVGIGDMSGDVFGNGMLLSPHLRLIAAFNHLHVFIDPDPDPETSFAERARLFELPRSGWNEYDTSLISEGGGVFERGAKSIVLSPQARRALGTDAETLSPAELIRVILAAPVDLLWNGGIGTYVKASTETPADVGDKSNDALRVDATELRCRVVGEGGNLGFTQQGRIEYALAGGRINTDAIDNVAGVNTSDHEVNIKILLEALVADGELTRRQRNELMLEMTDAVATQVLDASYIQSQAISLALAQAPPMIDVHARLIRHLEQVARLDRDLEFLPDEETIEARKAAHQGLVAPELAVLMAHTKIHLNDRLLHSDLPEDDYLGHDLERYFPAPLPERCGRRMHSHRLRREIVATVVANQLVDRAGTTFAFRLEDETAAPTPLIARAYACAREVFEMRTFWEQVEALDNQVRAQIQLETLIEGRRLVERATRWLLRSHPDRIEIEPMIARYQAGAQRLRDCLGGILEGSDRERRERHAAELGAAGVPAALAEWTSGMASLLAVFDTVEVAEHLGRDHGLVMATYFRLGCQLELGWLRDRIIELPRANRWQTLARAALRDDLYSLHRAITQDALEAGGEHCDSERAVDAWWEANADAVQRCLGMIADIRGSRTYDTTTLPVALREVRSLLRRDPDAPASQ